MLTEGATDPDVLRQNRLMDMVEEADVAGIEPTVGQATNDPGIKALEYGRLARPGSSGVFAAKRAQQNQKLSESLNEHIPAHATDEGILGDIDANERIRQAEFDDAQTQAILDAEMWQREGRISAEEAQAMIDEALESLPGNPSVARETASNQAADRVFGDAEDSVLSRERARRNELYGQVPDDIMIPTERWLPFNSGLRPLNLPVAEPKPWSDTIRMLAFPSHRSRTSPMISSIKR